MLEVLDSKSDINMSQVSVVKRCSAILVVVNLLLSASVKEFRKSVNI